MKKSRNYDKNPKKSQAIVSTHWNTNMTLAKLFRVQHQVVLFQII